MMDRVTLALPSKGAIADPTLSFLSDCGLRVDKPNPRQYTGSIPTIPSVDVLFQRVTDVVYKVSDGTAQLGVTGYDVVREHPHDDLIVIHPDLRYGYCKLLVAVPESWVDVESIVDLAEVALDFREYKRRNLRVATTFTNLTRQYLHEQGIHHFTILNAEGAIEVAPTIGYADVIVDLMQSGTTLRENHLKPLSDGVIVESQACLVGNRQALQDPVVLNAARVMLEHIDAALQGRSYSQVTVNMRGDSVDTIAARIVENPLTRGLQGPTIAPIYSAEGGWHTVTIIVSNKNLLSAVEYLRELGGTQASVIPVRYVFLESSPTFNKLQEFLAGAD
ncbi:MAG: ATP phosphoribosyltransferase [Chloroflexi bacterium]|uniref:ATP phosphoribosyltransferase n=1 Tax=Candidatus Flexifilum breve TaxID=3140694 RepID=UPI003136E09F|nr:ATP phosphoribosyltransferase [Chloroflexota bacterium]